MTIGMRRMLWVTAALVFAQSVPLTLRSDRTDRFFAWTIDVPVTAAFLGAGYLAAGVLELSAARRPTWQEARTGRPGRLGVRDAHPGGDPGASRPVPPRRQLAPDPTLSWGWVVLYAAVPVALGLLWWRQARAAPEAGTAGPPATAPLPVVLRHRARRRRGSSCRQEGPCCWPARTTPAGGRGRSRHSPPRRSGPGWSASAWSPCSAGGSTTARPPPSCSPRPPCWDWASSPLCFGSATCCSGTPSPRGPTRCSWPVLRWSGSRE